MSVNAHALTTVSSFGSNPGALAMFEHVPAGVVGAMPLVLVLHGCSQNSGYAEAVGLVDFADELGFGLVVAQQSSANNASVCFNWFEAGDIAPGSGEASSLANMVASFKDRHDVDDDRGDVGRCARRLCRRRGVRGDALQLRHGRRERVYLHEPRREQDAEPVGGPRQQRCRPRR